MTMGISTHCGKPKPVGMLATEIPEPAAVTVELTLKSWTVRCVSVPDYEPSPVTADASLANGLTFLPSAVKWSVDRKLPLA